MSDTAPQPSPSSPSAASGEGRLVLVTGVTGYVGGLVVQPLLDAGYRVRVLTRGADRLADRPWRDSVEVSEGDATSRPDLDKALDGVDVAYYLLHSMDGQGDFEKRDLEMARTFAAAAEAAGVSRIVYLGGLHPQGAELSPHLRSRVEVGQVFLDSKVPAACLQAAVVLGGGSVSFQMLRHLTERLPAMVAPKWLRNRIQPIAEADVVHYLVGAAGLPADVNRTFDIGGPEVLTYADMIKRFAQVTGRGRRWIETVPVLTPKLASYWIGLVTPVDPGVARPLVESLVHEVVRREHDLDEYVGLPHGGLTGFDEAVRTAMRGQEPSQGPRNLAKVSAAVTAAAVVGGIATTPDSRWYDKLDLPPWQPPTAAFPIVWTALYAVIAGTSASAITALQDDDRAGEAEDFAKALGANLVLNAGWSVAFWRVRKPWFAAAEAAALASSSADLARRAGRVGPGHRNALLPYAAWCGFATLLSAEIARRNPRG